jgi:hypothetical protein
MKEHASKQRGLGERMEQRIAGHSPRIVGARSSSWKSAMTRNSVPSLPRKQMLEAPVPLEKTDRL